MSKLAWLTPDAPTETVCRRVSIPNTLVYAFNGAVGELGSVWNWELFEGLTAQQSADLGFDIFDTMTDCELDKRMIGAIQYYAGIIPDGVLLCDGAEYTQIEYPDLYTSLGGNGGVFNVPDLQGKFIVGESVDYPINSTGGAATHVLTTSEMPAHTHPSQDALPDIDLEGAGVPLPSEGISFPAPTGATGGGMAHNNLPPYHSLYPGIIALPVSVEAVSSSPIEFAVVVDEKPINVDGGTFSSGAWRRRDLQKEELPATWLSLSVNLITLTEGEYFVIATAPAQGVTGHKARLRNLTTNQVFFGTSEGGIGNSVVYARYSILGDEVITLEHRAQVTKNNFGFGSAGGFAVEKYSQVMVVKYG